MDGDPAPMTIPRDDPVAVELLLAVRGGDLGTVGRLPAARPGQAHARLKGRDGGTRTPLHLVADWPGYSPVRSGPAALRPVTPGTRFPAAKPFTALADWEITRADLALGDDDGVILVPAACAPDIFAIPETIR